MSTPKGEWKDRPFVEKAHHFELAFCGAPDCGAHSIAKRENGEPICEIVASVDGTLALIEGCKDGLYAKIANSDNG